MRRLVATLAAASLGVACAADPHSGARGGEERGRYRHTQREYDGAPPVIPHAVEALGRQDCLVCHAEGMDLGDDGLAPRTPHPERVNCRQCHVEQAEPRAVFVATRFEGLRYPALGTRAYRGAPPTLPHPRAGREACLGCHGANGGSPLRTPHPDRVNCLQCHVEQIPDAGVFRDNAFGPRQGAHP